VLTSPFEAFARFESEHGRPPTEPVAPTTKTFCVRVALSKAKSIDSVMGSLAEVSSN
jgi:hypothetical protein